MELNLRRAVAAVVIAAVGIVGSPGALSALEHTNELNERPITVSAGAVRVAGQESAAYQSQPESASQACGSPGAI